MTEIKRLRLDAIDIAGTVVPGIVVMLLLVPLVGPAGWTKLLPAEIPSYVGAICFICLAWTIGLAVCIVGGSIGYYIGRLIGSILGVLAEHPRVDLWLQRKGLGPTGRLQRWPGESDQDFNDRVAENRAFWWVPNQRLMTLLVSYHLQTRFPFARTSWTGCIDLALMSMLHPKQLTVSRLMPSRHHLLNGLSAACMVLGIAYFVSPAPELGIEARYVAGVLWLLSVVFAIAQFKIGRHVFNEFLHQHFLDLYQSDAQFRDYVVKANHSLRLIIEPNINPGAGAASA